jgi:hypothetical protein
MPDWVMVAKSTGGSGFKGAYVVNGVFLVLKKSVVREETATWARKWPVESGPEQLRMVVAELPE